MITTYPVCLKRLDEHNDAPGTAPRSESYRWIESEWNKERARLFNVAHNILRNREDAEDAVQTTAMRVMRHYATFDRRREFAPWATQILVNIARDTIRRRRTARSTTWSEIALDGMVGGDILNYPDPAAQPLDRMLDREISPVVKSALAGLRDEYREPFMLSVIAGCSYEEIAGELCLPIGTVRSRIFRARKLLLQMLTAGSCGADGPTTEP